MELFVKRPILHFTYLSVLGWVGDLNANCSSYMSDTSNIPTIIRRSFVISVFGQNNKSVDQEPTYLLLTSWATLVDSFKSRDPYPQP